MVCETNYVPSNVVGLAYAEEACIRDLPNTEEDGFEPIWYALQPNSYKDFGGDSTLKARTPFNSSRQRQKGTPVSFSAAGGFTTDLTQEAPVRLMQGFFFAKARQKPTTQFLDRTVASHAITSVSTTDDSFNAATGLAVFRAGHIIKASGFGVGDNNKTFLAATVAAGKVTATSLNLVNEASPPATAKLEAVGYQFAAGELSVVATAGGVQLVLAGTPSATWAQLGLIEGEWIGIGGDTTVTRFADSEDNAPGFGRIWSIVGNTLTLNETTFEPASADGTAKTIRIWFGTVIKNEGDPALIKTFSYQLEQTLGNDADGVQSRYLEGAVPNGLTLNIPIEDFANLDLDFIALNEVTRTGAEGLKDGARVPSPAEDAFNTSSNVYRMKLSVVDPAEINKESLFAFVTEGSLTIGNNASPIKAIGHVGAVDVNVGNFDVGGSLTAIFSTVEALRAVRNNADAAFNLILAAGNAGIVFDIPLLGLGGGKLTIEQNNPIRIPLTSSAAQNEKGYTLLSVWFPYLPDVLMPVANN